MCVFDSVNQQFNRAKGPIVFSFRGFCREHPLATTLSQNYESILSPIQFDQMSANEKQTAAVCI